MEIITKSEKETLDWAKKYAKTLQGGEIIGLVGNLGAGKTILAKGLAQGLGVKNTVNSPTFVIMKIYSCAHKTIKQLVHIDAYRVGVNDIKSIGALEYFNKPDTVVIIEWADKIKEILTKNTKYININNLNAYTRCLKTKKYETSWS